MQKNRFFFYLSVAVVVLCGLIIVLAIPAWRAALVHLFELKKMEAIRSYIRSLGTWGPVLSILLMILHSVTFIPSEIILIANLAIFGPVCGFIYTWIGSMLGAYLAFFMAKGIGRPIAKKFASDKLVKRIDVFVQEHGLLGLLALRFIPVISFNALNYAAGFTNITLWQFTWTTGLGIVPAEILFAFLYQSVTGLKYVIIGLTVAGGTLLLMLILKHRLEKKWKD